MSQLNEIKCPHCGHWVVWNCRVDDKCPHCGEYLEEQRFAHAEQKRMAEEAKKKDDYFVIKDSDETITQIYKTFLNIFRWGAFYGIPVVFIIVGALVVIYGLVIL
ncbi:MAG TPA: hypothetical protein VHE59_02965 [Mucilaginibacter sp.]|nr:hypothetical protein [Mucilaginibacter sp.]